MEANAEFSIEQLLADGNQLTKPAQLVLQDWTQLAALLPSDLDASSKATGALVRRREIRRAIDLLRVLLVHALCGWSLRTVGAWAVLQGLADVSDVALYKRFCNSVTWLGQLVLHFLAQSLVRRPESSLRLRLADATVVHSPGRKGTNWRMHLGLDLGSMRLHDIELTDAKGAESLARLTCQAGEIVIADRGYAYARSLGAVLTTGAWLIGRIRWQNLPLLDAAGQRLDIIAWLQQTFAGSVGGAQSVTVQLPTPQGTFAMRLLALPLPQEAADRARARARKKAAKDGLTPDARSLFAAGYLLLITNLPAEAWSDEQVCDLYGLRWQIEMHIKRLKSIVGLGELQAEGALARACLLAKLLAALLIERLTAPVLPYVPVWLRHYGRAISPWRLTKLAWEHLRSLVLGVLPWETLLDNMPKLRRFLSDPPRKRRQQWAAVLTLLLRLSVVNVPALS